MVRATLTIGRPPRKEKAVVPSLDLTDAVQQFDRFVRPLLAALVEGAAPGRWPPEGPWS